MSTRTSAIRTRWAAVGAAVAITLGAAGIGGLDIASADVSSGDRPVFIPINPCRLVDTRPGELTVGPRSTPVGPAQTITVVAHGTNGECTGPSAIPTDAVSLALNVTAVGPSSNTFLTFWGDGANPGTSNLNPRAGGAPTPNSVNTPLSTSGTFNIFNDRGSVNVIVDVNGYYASHDHDDLYARIPTQLNVAPSNFEATDEDPTEWYRDGVAISHQASVDLECIFGSFDIPAGHDVTGAELVYIAADENETVRLRVRGLVSEPGPRPVGTFLQDVAGFTGTLLATPDGSGGAVTGSQLIERQPLTLQSGATAISPDEYTYHAEICTANKLTVYGFRVFIAPA